MSENGRKYKFSQILRPVVGMLVAVIINLLSNKIAVGMGLPLYLDSIGTFLAAAMDMYALTHDRDYLHDAIMAADYTVCNLTDPTTGLMNNVARSMNGGDGGLFHGIFFRYLTRLILCSDTPDEMRNSLRRFVADNARLAMSCLDGEAMIFSRNWLTESIGKNEPAPLTPHVTGCTLLAAQIEVMRNY